MKKRLLSLFLMLVLVLTIAPVSAFADVGDNMFVEIESNDSMNSANKIYDDCTIQGSLSGADIDYFRFVLNARSEVTIACMSQYYCLIGIIDENNNVVAADLAEQDSNGNYTSGMITELPAGTYYFAPVYDNDHQYSHNIYVAYITWSTVTHTHSYTSTVTLPSCTEQGYTSYTCSVCGDSRTSDYVPALGHNYENSVCTRCGAVNNPFVDVSEGEVYYDAIMWAYYHTPKQITGGFDATHFVPSNPCTRAQVVTFLWRAAGEPEPAAADNPFSDVSAVQANGNENPYYKAILWASENGITTGYGDGTFRPNDTVTRAQFVTFLWRYEDEPKTSGSINGFTDAGQIAAPYQQAVAWAVEKSITTGYNDGTFRSNNTCTRWAVVLFMYRDMT